MKRWQGQQQRAMESVVADAEWNHFEDDRWMEAALSVWIDPICHDLSRLKPLDRSSFDVLRAYLPGYGQPLNRPFAPTTVAPGAFWLICDDGHAEHRAECGS